MHRRRYKNPLRAQVIDYLCRYDEIKSVGGCTALTIINAIDRVMDSTKSKEDGQMTCDIIDMIYIKKTHTAEGVAGKLHVGRPTVFRMINRFIYEVCIEAGLLKVETLGSEP